MWLFSGCSKVDSQQNSVLQTNPEPIRSTSDNGQNGDGVFPRNDSGDPSMQWQSMFVYTFLTSAWNENLELKGGSFPQTYDDLISTGLMPIILKNRYTGEAIKSVPDYSPGDFYFSADPATGLLVYAVYYGNQDQIYDPDLTDGKFDVFAGNPRHATTDGKTVRTEIDFSPEAMNPSYGREWRNIPVGDDARTAIYVVYQSIRPLMYQACDVLEYLPSSLDDYIALVGEKNPAAWTNPYTGGPMTEVGWYDVRNYYNWDPLQEPLLPENGEDIPDSIAGNYSFSIQPSPKIDGEYRAYAKFYFREPDGSISAYLAFGLGPEESRNTAFLNIE